MKKKVAKYKLFNSKLTSVFSISMVLFMLGIISMLLLVGNGLSSYVRENFTLSVILKETAPEPDILSLEKKISQENYVKNIRYVSKDAALAELAVELGDDPMSFVQYNPLPAMFEINLKSNYANSDSLFYIAKKIERNDVVKNVDYQKTLIYQVDKNIQKITISFLAIAVLLLIISFILINNTMKLLIYSNRFLIHTMKLVGATKGFIRKPYIRQGIWIGLLASLLAMLYIVGLLWLFRSDLEMFIDLYDVRLYAVVFGSIVFFGIVITAAVSLFSVNKYLKHNLDDLYYI